MNFDYQKRMIATAATLALSVVLVAAAIWWPKVERNIDVMDLMFVIDIT
jgi:predicted anti-sigma-YlaC factor YlaD